MIKSLQIKNFQSHKNTLLELDPGVNVIVGTTDSGKSAILRSLRWLIFNKPSGDSMRSWWGGNTQVSIDTDFCRIARNKGDVNSYVLGIPIATKEVLEFKAFGTNVPQEVLKALNMSEINLQSQMDSPFLLSDACSPGDVASHFNKVANLDRIDLAQQNVEKEIRSLTADIKYKKADRIKQQTKLAEYDYLEKYEIELEVLESMVEKQENLTKNISKFTRLINSLDDLETQVETASDLLQYEEEVDDLLELLDKKIDISSRIMKLNHIISDYSYSKKQEKSYGWKIPLESSVVDLSNLIDQRKTAGNPVVRLGRLLNSLNDIRLSLKENNQSLRQQIGILEKEMPDICPFCETVLKKK